MTMVKKERMRLLYPKVYSAWTQSRQDGSPLSRRALSERFGLPIATVCDILTKRGIYGTADRRPEALREAPDIYPSAEVWTFEGERVLSLYYGSFLTKDQVLRLRTWLDDAIAWMEEQAD